MFAEIVADPKRKISVEIGDSKQQEFMPQFKTLHWGNECNFSVRLVDDDPATEQVNHLDGKTIWWKGHRTARFYRTNGLTEHDHDGGYEFEVELAAKPRSNVLRFTIQSKGLAFYYQPPLNLLDTDSVRPDNIVGSYAVYHASKRNDFDTIHYRVGKAFHIYRPHATSANGKRVWCELNIDERARELTVTIPQEFLDQAVYPIVIDPTIGYTTVGGTSQPYAASSINRGSLNSQYTASAGDTVTLFSLYGTAANRTASVSMYSIVAGLPSAQLAAPVTFNISITTGWYSSAAISQSLTASTIYDIAFGLGTTAKSTGSLLYDTGSGNQESTAATGALPSTWSSTGTDAKMFSAYATYTVGNSATPPSPTIVDIAAQMAVRAKKLMYGWSRSKSGILIPEMGWS